jgi:hypothetical protein
MDYQEVLRTDAAAVDAMADPLRDSGKPLVVTSGTLVFGPDPDGADTPESSVLSKMPLNNRMHAERDALEMAANGARVCAVRLAPYVYGRGGTGVRLFMQMTMTSGEVVYVDDGSS